MLRRGLHNPASPAGELYEVGNAPVPLPSLSRPVPGGYLGPLPARNRHAHRDNAR